MPHKDRETRRAYEQRRRQDPAYRAAHQRANQRYKARDPEAYRAKKRVLYAKNRAKEAARKKAQRIANLAAIHLREQIRRTQMSPEQRARINARNLARLRAHPELRREQYHRRKARKLQAQRNDLTREQEAIVLAAKQGVCDYCKAYYPACKTCKRHAHKLTIDHITALTCQGDHTLWNVTACCHRCNAKKGIKSPPVPVQPLLL